VAVALAECCVAGGIGAQVALPDALELFAEAPGTAFLVSGEHDAVAAIGNVIGSVGGPELRIDGHLVLAVSELADAQEQGLAEFV
jgi:hypothetical protein